MVRTTRERLDHLPDSTLADVDDGSSAIRSRWIQRAGLALLALIVLAGAVGLLGVHTATTTAQADGYTLTVTYPRIARAGLDTQWQVRLQHPGGFGEHVTLEVSGDYFGIFETQGWFPGPSAETRDGQWYRMTFDPPDADTFVLDYDAYIQPSSQVGRSGQVRVLVDHTVVVSAGFDTWLVP